MRVESPYLRDAARGLREPGPSRLDRIPIEECGEGILDIREACPGVLVETAMPWARATVCRMLREAAERIPAGTRLRVINAFRTLEAQCAGWETYREFLREQHPAWPQTVLRREANRFVHPPDRPCPPGHTTGAALDVALVREDGQPLEGIEEVFETTRDVWRTFGRRVPQRAREARRLLYDAMVSSGFSNCYDEWWHYSWGDSGWAGRLGHPVALYGVVPEECFPEELAAIVADLRASDYTSQLRQWLAAALRGDIGEGAPPRPAH